MGTATVSQTRRLAVSCALDNAELSTQGACKRLGHSGPAGQRETHLAVKFCKWYFPVRYFSAKTAMSISTSNPLAWQSDADTELRRNMENLIFRTFQHNKPEVTARYPPEELAVYIKRLEDALYRTAPSREAYIDRNTLVERLHYVARLLTGRIPGRNVPSF